MSIAEAEQLLIAMTEPLLPPLRPAWLAVELVAEAFPLAGAAAAATMTEAALGGILPLRCHAATAGGGKQRDDGVLWLDFSSFRMKAVHGWALSK